MNEQDKIKKLKEAGFDVYSTAEGWERLDPNKWKNAGLPHGYNHPNWSKGLDFEGIRKLFEDTINDRLKEH